MPNTAITHIQNIAPGPPTESAVATPAMLPLHQQDWQTYSAVWNTDTKLAFHWTQAAMRDAIDGGPMKHLASGDLEQGDRIGAPGEHGPVLGQREDRAVWT